MKKHTIIIVLTAALICVVSSVAFAQEDITALAFPAFENAQRPPAVFMHDAHNEKAGLEACGPCHHTGFENGEFVEGDPVPCADCHSVEGDGTALPLMLASHKLCADCHTKMNKGPLACGECHKR